MDPLGNSSEQYNGLNAPISLNEIMIAIDIGKAPGSDGFTPEFYKILKFCLAHRLYNIFAAAFESMKVPSSRQEPSVVLIPKEGKDLSVPQCYRSISLFNVSYKILMSILAS